MRSAGALAAACAAAALLFAGCGGGDTTPPAAATPEPTAAAVATVPATIAGADRAAAEFEGIRQRGSLLGNARAKHTLVIFGDLICPACAVYSSDILPPVFEQFVRAGKLRVELRPFGFVAPASTMAAQYAWAAAAQDRMYEFTTLWYANQGDERVDYATDEFARKLAESVEGLDPDQLILDAHKPSTRQGLDEIGQTFISMGFQGVPAFAAGATGGELVPLDLGESGREATRALEHVLAQDS